MGTSYLDQADDLNLTPLERFDGTYARLHQAVYANIYKIVQNHPVAEDLLQDVFLAFWENMDGIESARIANWLFVVSFNKSLSFIKKTGRVEVHRYSTQIDAVADIPETDEAEFEQKMLKVYEAIELLPERKREIFKQYRMEGKGIEQIASEMQLSVHTVKDHLKIANKMIRDSATPYPAFKMGIDMALIALVLAY